ncbi:MAG: DUF3460 family protein [Neisseria sp.]|nr:DUF3460 family protein [Neisseria sp.]
MYNYQSDITRFLDDYLEKHPQEAAQRMENRAKLWDVELNPIEQEDFAAAGVARGAYAYQSE